MKIWIGAVLLAAMPVGGTAAGSKAEAKKEPFYRKYLVPGNKLDDQILEQERRVDAAPEDSGLRNDFGNLLAARRFPAQAAEQYEMALKLDKTNFISAYNLGLVRETEDKIGAAISAYKRAISRKPGFPQAHFRLGRLYEHRGEKERAVGEYAKAMRIDPAMREPRRNPLVVDSELIYAASLVNYRRDIAEASMQRGIAFVEESRFRKVPVDRPVASQEVSAAEPEPAPRDIGPANAAGAPAETGAPLRAPRPAAAEGPAAVPGGRPRASAVRPKAPAGAPPVAAEPPPGQDSPVPETMPEPTPTPTPEAPVEVEPS